MLAEPKYRPDVDGLRAIAVLAVVAFHAFPDKIRGGFVGVDVFFVISGFLISSIILEKVASGTFTFADFYARRIRRILPALVLVVLSVASFGYFVLVEDEFAVLGKHLISAAAFLSNLTLYQESGYFDAGGDSKPLLHLWSLAIEEQFYMVWPVAVVFFARKGWRLGVLITGVAVASFLANLILVRWDESAAFYWPVSRFWELMAGGALAHLARTRTAVISRYADLKSFVGLGLVLVSVYLLRADRAFPGWWALLPVLGTTLLISSPTAWLNRHVLSLKPLVWVGLISYPLYLWHWPLLSYAHVLEDRTPLGRTRLILVALSFVLAALTYLVVERPIRFGGGPNRERLLIGGLALVGVFGLTAFTAPQSMNREMVAPQLVNRGDIGHEEFYDYMKQNYFPCQAHEIASGAGKYRGLVRCFQTKQAQPTTVIIGDSHAEHLLIGFAEANPGESVAYYLRSPPPILDNLRFNQVFEYVLADPAITDVVLTFYWRAPNLLLEEEQLRRTVIELRSAGKRVHLVKNGPRFSFFPQRCKYDGAVLREANKCEESAADALPNEAFYSRIFDRVAKETGSNLIEIKSLFCSEATCSMSASGQLLFRDRHHLNVAGAKHAAQRLSLTTLRH